MGGKSSQSTQTVSIPPEVLARYNAVNTRAENVAATPFQTYSLDPNAFVAPLTPTQQAGIANTNTFAGSAQPYYQAATNYLTGAQAAAEPYYAAATSALGQGTEAGNLLAGSSLNALAAGQAAAAQPQAAAAQGFNRGYYGAQPFNQAATAFGLAGAQAVNPTELDTAAINRYLSPYLGTVLQGTAGLLNQQNQQAMAGQTGSAIRQGAFGGDRAGIAAANLSQQQQLANAKIFSDILNQGYGQALGTAQQQQQVGLGAAQANRAALQQTGQQMGQIGQQIYGQGLGYGQAQQGLGQQLFGQGSTSAQQLAALGQQLFGQGATSAQQLAALGQGVYGLGANTSQGLAGLGAGAQGAGLQGAQAQLAAGQTAQQTQNAGLQALYNQFLQQQSYPFQVAQFVANIAEGTGALSGSTTTTNQTLSDRRAKENIKAIGKTFDGQTIYSYNLKGSPQTEIGLIAQEVEKRHPEAVGLAGGLKTVNYDKATDDAADRGHFAYGGGVSMGGGVMPSSAGQGFWDGGGVVGFDPGLMQQILASYQQMYAPMAGGSGGLGAASFVPQANLPVSELRVAGDLPAMQSPMAGMSEAVGLGKDVAGLAKEFGVGRGKNKSDEDEDALVGLDADYSRVKDPENNEARGGLVGYATGGMPYSQQTSLDIPNEKPDISELKGSQSSIEPLKDNTLDSVSKGVGILKNLASIGKMAGMFSDRRLKDNIKAVGKTFDGQTVYSYNYKGDPQTRMGLIAQEVEKQHPGAVMLDGDYKRVDYKKATGLAAKRKHFADGGEAFDPDFNLDPEDIISQGDPFLEAIMRASRSEGVKPETDTPDAEGHLTRKVAAPAPAEATGLAPSIERPETPIAQRPSGLSAIARMIRGQEGLGRNPRSSATGPYQMINSTFTNYFRKMYPDKASGMSDRDIVALRNTPQGMQIAEAIGPQIIRDNARILSSSGFEPNARNVYLAHFFGPQAAIRVLSAHPDTPIERIVGNDAISANPFLSGKSASDTLRFVDNAMGRQKRLLGAPEKADGGPAGLDPNYDIESQLADAREDLDNERGAPANIVPPKIGAQTDAPAKGLAAANTYQDVASEVASAGPSVLDKQPQRQGLGRQVSNVLFNPTKPPIDEQISRIPGYATDYLRTPFFKGIGRGSAQSWIPLLTGLSTAFTQPYRNPFMGLMAGVGAGAQTYAALANERNKQLPARQLAAARQAEVARTLANELIRQDPYDPTRFIYMAPGTNGVSISAGQAQDLRRQMLTGTMNYMPEAPQGVQEWKAVAPKAPKYVPSGEKPNMGTVEGIVEAGMAVPEVRNAYNAYKQAEADQKRAQASTESPFGSEVDKNIAGARLVAATQVASTAKANFELLLGKFTDSNLANLQTSISNIGASNIDAYNRYRMEKDAYARITPVIDAMRAQGFKGGVGTGFWNALSSAAITLGVPEELVGNGQTETQRQAALAKLLEGTGVSPDIFSVETPEVALKAVADALDKQAKNAQSRYDQAQTALRNPTAKPTLLNVNTPPSAPPKKQREPFRTKSGMWIVQSAADAQNNPKIKNGQKYRVYNKKTNSLGEIRTK